MQLTSKPSISVDETSSNYQQKLCFDKLISNTSAKEILRNSVKEQLFSSGRQVATNSSDVSSALVIINCLVIRKYFGLLSAFRDMIKFAIILNGNTVTPTTVAELHATTCRENNGKVPKGSLASKLQSIVDRNRVRKTIATDPETVIALSLGFSDKEVDKSDAKMLTQLKKGKVKRNSFESTIQAAADRTPQAKDVGIHAIVKELADYPVSQQYASQLQSETASACGFVPTGSFASLAQSAAKKSNDYFLLHETNLASLSDQDVSSFVTSKKGLAKLQSVATKENFGKISTGSAISHLHSSMDRAENTSVYAKIPNPNTTNTAITSKTRPATVRRADHH